MYLGRYADFDCCCLFFYEVYVVINPSKEMNMGQDLDEQEYERMLVESRQRFVFSYDFALIALSAIVAYFVGMFVVNPLVAILFY